MYASGRGADTMTGGMDVASGDPAGDGTPMDLTSNEERGGRRLAAQLPP